MNKLILFTLLFSLCFVPCLLQSAGVPYNGYANYRERTALVFTNFVRMSPAGYKVMFLPTATHILNQANHPPVPPVRYNYEMSRASRSHAAQLATVSGCPFGHNSCNGASFGSRIRSYYKLGSTWGEVLQAGAVHPALAIKSLIYDGGAYDKTLAAGHRHFFEDHTLALVSRAITVL